MPNKSNSPKPEEKKPPAKPKKVMAAKGGKKKEETALRTASTSKTTTPNQMILDLSKNPEFLEGFWKGLYGNSLVKRLNDYAQSEGLEDRIRREKESPVVYVIVLNDGDFPFKEKGVQWKLCKVGFTHRSIKKGTGNRMEKVKNEILSKYNGEKPKGAKHATASVLFALPFGAVDTTPYNDAEVRIREMVGKSVLKAKAKEIGLPVPTEWVLTTQQYIDVILEEIDKMKGKESSDKAKMEAAKGESCEVDLNLDVFKLPVKGEIDKKKGKESSDKAKMEAAKRESCEVDLNLDVFKQSKLRFTAVPPDKYKDWLASKTKKKQ